jgi:hypothetical protein
VHHLFIELKQAYDSYRGEVLYNVLVDFGIYMKLITLTKMCLNKTYNRVRVGRHLSDTFSVKNGWEKKKMSYLHCFSSLFIRRIYGDSDKAGGLEIKWYTLDSCSC